jgi:hypothetical protein
LTLVVVLPPLAQFFVGFFLTLVIAGGSVLLIYWLGLGEEE